MSDPAPAQSRFGFDVREAWRRGDPEIEADAIAFWTRLGLLPAGVDPAERVKELIAVAYQDGRLIAMATATIEYVEHLRARFAILRGATDPEFRRSRAQLALAVPSREALIRWGMSHPEEKLAGGLAVIRPGEWGEFEKLPVWPESELAVTGYTAEGAQVRAAWFDYFRFD